MIDTRLIDTLTEMAKKEKKVKEYKRRVRVKGIVKSRGLTKNKNISLSIKKEGEQYKFTVIKTHKERFALAKKLTIGKSVSIEGIPKFRAIICTRLKLLGKAASNGRQAKLNRFKEG